MTFRCPFILASSSPRRRTLLSRLGVPFEMDAADVDESIIDGMAPTDLVTELALEKARRVASRHPGAIVLGADTVVVLGGAVLGKPGSADEAMDMLARLSGRTHLVHTGIALVHRPSGREVAEFETTRVRFAELGEDERREYVASGSPLDKAGAYGIQDDAGAWFIAGIEGDFYNVVGLPLHRLYRMVRREFLDLVVGPDPES